jgi:hypothetical protein
MLRSVYVKQGINMNRYQKNNNADPDQVPDLDQDLGFCGPKNCKILDFFVPYVLTAEKKK